jgi:putative transcriptional regulator
MTNAVKEARSKRGITQAELAATVNVSRQTIISVESGRYVPSVALALKIARALNQNVEQLFFLEKTD